MDSIYEFRTYFADAGRAADLYVWWRDHIISVYREHFDLVGVFENHAEIGAPSRGISVLIRYADAADVARSTAAMLADPRTEQLNSLPPPLTRDIVLSYDRNFLTVADFGASPDAHVVPS